MKVRGSLRTHPVTRRMPSCREEGTKQAKAGPHARAPDSHGATCWGTGLGCREPGLLGHEGPSPSHLSEGSRSRAHRCAPPRGPGRCSGAGVVSPPVHGAGRHPVPLHLFTLRRVSGCVGLLQKRSQRWVCALQPPARTLDAWGFPDGSVGRPSCWPRPARLPCAHLAAASGLLATSVHILVPRVGPPHGEFL